MVLCLVANEVLLKTRIIKNNTVDYANGSITRAGWFTQQIECSLFFLSVIESLI